MTDRTQPRRACLQELAAQRRLPAHQLMDRMTLQWIADNQPVNFAPAPSFPRPGLMLVPARPWFTTERQADSNHGILHNARVSLLAALLAQEYGLEDDDIAAACVAGAIHDCRRHDDQADAGHGRRAASWLLHHTDAVTDAMRRPVAAVALHRAAEAIAVHDVPYGDFTAQQKRTYEASPHLVDVLKAADCLDRYRLPLQRWWPELTHLRTPVPNWLPPAAFALVVRSERAVLDGATHHVALTTARQSLTQGQ